MNNIGKFEAETNLHNHVKNLFPICRSITGRELEKLYLILKNYHKEFKRLRFPTGKKVFDWEIPKEWIIRNAYLEHLETGKKYAEFKKNNLHLVGYFYSNKYGCSFKMTITNLYFRKST